MSLNNNNIKIRVKGHETFVLREGWMTKGLTEIQKDPLLFSKNMGADALGVGTNMAKSIRYWLREGGLTTDRPREGTFLTDLGMQIFQKDPYIEEDFSLWLVHANLSARINTVTSWYSFFNLLEIDEFTREGLYLLMKQQLEILAGNVDISERSVNDDCNALLHMYTKERMEDYDPEDKKISPFARLGLIKKEGNKYRKVQPDLNILPAFIILYLLQRHFRKTKESSINISDLLDKEYLPGRVLHLKRAAINDYLDTLAGKNLITVNRTAGLDMVYQASEWSELEVVKEYYKEIKR